MHAPSYPIFLSLENASILIAGIGNVGTRKLVKLVPCRPKKIHIIDTNPPSPEADKAITRARAQGTTCLVTRGIPCEEDITGMDLVFVCTSDHELNARLAHACRQQHILCNCTDNPSLGSFHVPVVARKGDVSVALSTERTSPALARSWKPDLEDFVANKDVLARFMGEIRPLVLSLGYSSEINASIFRDLAADQKLARAIAAEDMDRIDTIILTSLPYEICEQALDILRILIKEKNL